ncbi:MAG: hypothetical protein P1U56_24910 [Saprospiraceae bacterium]|nr:hypothetical protein [Saprospiraceae bacterium]
MQTTSILESLDILEKATTTEEITTEIQNILNAFQTMDVRELEPLLDEELEVGSEKLDKYYFLAVLRDVFIKYKEYGDTQLKVEEGNCGGGCSKTAVKVVNIRGVQSNKNFAFVIEKEQDSISGIHFCPAFIHFDKTRAFACPALTNIAYKKRDEMSGKDISNWNDDESIETIRKIAQMFDDAGIYD